MWPESDPDIDDELASLGEDDLENDLEELLEEEEAVEAALDHRDTE